ncbi:MAG: hypothetical protein ACREMA_18890 [Longimicrobiales bacterium]
MLSHELRNPLNVISVWTHVLGRHVMTDEGRRGLAAVECHRARETSPANRHAARVRWPRELAPDLVPSAWIDPARFQQSCGTCCPTRSSTRRPRQRYRLARTGRQ